MTTDILRLECDNLVIGGGLAGLTAALRLRGRTVVATAGLGATAISSGVFSLPGKRDLAAERWLLGTLRSTGCPYQEGHCTTEALAGRIGLVQETMDYEGAPTVVSLDVKPFAGRSCQEIAHMIEADEAALEALGSALSAMGGESYLLPPVLGITRTAGVRRRLERAANARIYEYVTAPSVLGLRLLRALREVVDREGSITVLETTRVDKIGEIGDGARGHMGTKGKRDVQVSAARLVIATGGSLTGFRVDGERIHEPLTGVTVGDIEADLDRSFAADHPLMYKGIGVHLPPTGGFRQARAAGAVAVGHGLYEALRTGYHAGDDL